MTSEINSLPNLASAIQSTHERYLLRAQKQINSNLTLRNWTIGFYIFEYEQNGQDRAAYGEELWNPHYKLTPVAHCNVPPASCSKLIPLSHCKLTPSVML